MKTTTGFVVDRTRYDFDFCACNSKAGWAQVDTYQDAPYFGVWINPIRLLIFTFAEGDTIRQQCESADEFKAEVVRLINIYSDADQPAKIDPMCRDDIISAFADLELGDLLH